MTEALGKNSDGPTSGDGRGKLILIGGSEDKNEEMEILRIVAREAGAAEARIEVITTASSEPEKSWLLYEHAFKTIGVRYAQPMHLESRAEAENPALLDRVAKATAILFIGGDQLRITSILDATPVMDAIRRHFFEEGKLVAGTSAGAAALTGTTIYDGDSPTAFHKGSVSMTGGLGLIRNAVVDTHFVTRGRIGRLIQVVASNPRLIGIGLGEDTGVLVQGGTEFRVIGSGLVIVVDGTSISYTDVTDVERMEPFSVENVTVHVLSSGAGFNMETRSVLRPPKKEPARNDSEDL